MSNQMRFATDLSKGILGAPDSEEMWTEILSHIPDSVLLKPGVRILNVACGHGTPAIVLAKRMMSLGVSKEDTRDSIWLLDKYKTFTGFVIKNLGFKNVITADFLTWETDMKFDAVIGNPPYQSEKENSDQLWPLFTEKSIELAAENGYVSLVIPDTWTSGTRSLMKAGRKNLLSEVFTNHTVKMLHFDVKKYFPGVGSGFSAFVLQNAVGETPTLIITPSEQFELDITGINYFPKKLNRITIDIAKKVTSHTSSCVYFKFYGKTDNLELVKEKDSGHQFEYANTSSNHNTMWGNVFGQGFGRKKVIYAYMGSKKKFSYDVSGDVSLMHNGRAFEFDVAATEESLKSYFESKLVRFLDSDKWSQYNEPKILNLLPLLDLTRTWSDAELYSHFDLTQEEIDYIESTVK